MDDYRKTEGILYGHFRKQKRIQKLKSKLIRINNRIDRLKSDIMNNNIELNDTLKSIDYSSTKVQTSNSTSSIERELERAIEQLMRELENELRERRKTESKIRYLIKKVDDVAIILEQLIEEELRIVELKYGEEKNLRQMESMLLMGKSTIQRKKDKIIEFLSSELWDKSGTRLGHTEEKNMLE